ncbi:GYDIA family GHMP kinase [Subsaxibacter sp. CAU 1640]|uniref:GYDIA family GHMP kinase n=1 Tax=Subsaxibacter sp. CAU 1640 TaxID=2933271 RepID=UPI002002E919|nr:GYDIA family GHMP kinase [Subsaxibacter sp. CAU 1640]MCK7590281.1 GYDIA family GHMP kinase [Subsaxibacter sp. CAU 1640]
MPETFYSNGKLLITGEYLVLDGALSLALPTKFGQSLAVEKTSGNSLVWNSFDDKNQSWFHAEVSIGEHIDIITTSDKEICNQLLKTLRVTRSLNPSFLLNYEGFDVKTHLDFPRQWGLGTSSTLINNIANWSKIDAYELLEKTFGGSGYDIACAQHNHPILYQRIDGKPIVTEVSFKPNFKDQIFFVYLNKKQNSREAIANYRKKASNLSNEFLEINDITKKMVNCQDLTDFQLLMNNHEHILSKILRQQPIKERLFSDFDGSIKSLGAWGGDFVMAASEENPVEYFQQKGFSTILPYSELIL